MRPSCSCTAPLMNKSGVIVCGRCDAPILAAATGVYSQYDGERPTGCGGVKYLRTWHRARDAGDPGATVDGRARLMTLECYERHRRKSEPKPKVETPKVEDDVLGLLGLEVAS